MSDRQKNLEHLSAYLDGELSPAEAQRLTTALAADAELAAELERLRKTRELIRHLPRRAAGGDFVANVLAQAERMTLRGDTSAPPARPATHWGRLMAVAAVLLIAAGVGLIAVATIWSTSGSGPLAGPLAAHSAKTDQPLKPVSAPAGDGLVMASKDKERAEKSRSLSSPAMGKAEHKSAGSAEPASTTLVRHEANKSSGGNGAGRGGEPANAGAGTLNLAVGKAGGGSAGRDENLAKNPGATAAAPAAETIVTDDLDAAGRQVALVLADSGLRQISEPASGAALAEKSFIVAQAKAGPDEGPRFQIDRKNNQIQILAYVPATQMPQVRQAVERVRAQQGNLGVAGQPTASAAQAMPRGGIAGGWATQAVPSAAGAGTLTPLPVATEGAAPMPVAAPASQPAPLAKGAPNYAGQAQNIGTSAGGNAVVSGGSQAANPSASQAAAAGAGTLTPLPVVTAGVTPMGAAAPAAQPAALAKGAPNYANQTSSSLAAAGGDVVVNGANVAISGSQTTPPPASQPSAFAGNIHGLTSQEQAAPAPVEHQEKAKQAQAASDRAAGHELRQQSVGSQAGTGSQEMQPLVITLTLRSAPAESAGKISGSIRFLAEPPPLNSASAPASTPAKSQPAPAASAPAGQTAGETK